MSTISEIGLPRLQKLRHHIGALRHRMEFLQGDIEARRADGRLFDFQVEEVTALEWAIPVLEAEWDNLARLRRNIHRIEQRSNALERRNIPVDDKRLAIVPPWEPPASSWLEEAAISAEAHLRAMPREMLGPAARRLLDAIDAQTNAITSPHPPEPGKPTMDLLQKEWAP